MKSRHALVSLAIAITLSGCVVDDPILPSPSSPADPTSGGIQPSPSREIEPSDDDPRPSTSGSTTAPAPTPTIDPLNDFEEALAGTWRRYHVKNSGYSSEYGYYEYVSFNEDRTACKWKYGEESSSDSTDDVFDEGDYTHWAITEELSSSANSFRVVVEGRGLDYVFDFTENIVYPAGFDTLVFGPTTDGKSCIYRSGASY